MLAAPPATGEVARSAEPTFVDDPRPIRATPDSLDDAAAKGLEAGIEGIREKDPPPDAAP